MKEKNGTGRVLAIIATLAVIVGAALAGMGWVVSEVAAVDKRRVEAIKSSETHILNVLNPQLASINAVLAEIKAKLP